MPFSTRRSSTRGMPLGLLSSNGWITRHSKSCRLMSSLNQNSSQYERHQSINHSIAGLIAPKLAPKAVMRAEHCQTLGGMLTSNLLSAQLYELFQLVDGALIAYCAAKARI
jgi:hypothetical protein